MTYDWHPLVNESVGRWGTPCYLFSWLPVLEALDELEGLRSNLPIRHWLSFKTQPMRPLLNMWRKRGSGVEVVSEYELRAALSEGYAPDQILVNGVAKHTWLGRTRVPNLRVHVDSPRELPIVTELANEWSKIMA